VWSLRHRRTLLADCLSPTDIPAGIVAESRPKWEADTALSDHIPDWSLSQVPDILFESECQQLLTTASSDPRIYVLVLMLLETGIKKEELFDLKLIHFDFSNKYAPELWVKHTGKKVKKDRKLKLPAEVVPVFADVVRSIKRGEGIETVLRKIGLSEPWEDARQKYERLAMGGI
jgi:integrase